MQKINEWDHVKLKHFGIAKEMVNKTETQPAKQEKI